MWMNEYEVGHAVFTFAEHELLGPASLTLANLVAWTNDNSDGWPYWRKPSQAARRLQELLWAAVFADRQGREMEVTAAQVRAAYTPVKAFLTRQGVDHDSIVVTP